MNVAFSPPNPPLSSDRRILSLHFPRLSTDRISRYKWARSWRSTGRPDHPPIVCAGRLGNAVRLTAVDDVAEEFGLRIGQGLAEARAMCPVLDVVDTDAAADRQFLEGLADWCDRYTPLVAIDGKSGLMLDITGCAHLFGGERAMLDDMVKRFLQLGIDARGAISSAPGLSWALARFGDVMIAGPHVAEEVLAPLPLACLRLETETVSTLAKVGLKRVHHLMALPRAPLARRFGAAVLLRLDQALGRVSEPISPRRPLAMLSVERQLAEPISTHEMVLELVERLAARLKTGLEARGEGGRLFELLLFRIDGRVYRVEVGTAAPLREPRRITALYRERLQALADDLDAGYGFELVRLNLLRSEDFPENSPRFSAEDEEKNPLPDFLDKVAARLEPGCLRLPLARAKHWPERASRMMALSDGIPDLMPAFNPPPRSERPIRLFIRPEPVKVVTAEVPHGPPASFWWRRIRYRVRRAEGPERLSAEWWMDGEEAQARDYFRIEDSGGRRFWLYREGLYERGDANPVWFMQGIFA